MTDLTLHALEAGQARELAKLGFSSRASFWYGMAADSAKDAGDSEAAQKFLDLEAKLRGGIIGTVKSIRSGVVTLT